MLTYVPGLIMMMVKYIYLISSTGFEDLRSLKTIE